MNEASFAAIAGSGGGFQKSDLTSDSLFVLHASGKIYVWIGNGVSSELKKKAVETGTAFLEQNKLPADLQIQARISVEGKGNGTSVQVVKEKMESPMFKDSFQKWEEQDFKDKVKEAKTKPEKAEVHSVAQATLITISIMQAGGYWSIGSGSDCTSHKADGYR